MAISDAHGQFVPELFRAFTERSHLLEFLEGKIRFGLLSHYRGIEDEKRHDPTEGISHVEFRGIDHHAFFASNAIYVLCFSQNINAVQGLGRYIAHIKDPWQFAKDINNCLSNDGRTYYGGLEGVIVEYSKGHKVEAHPETYQLARLAYAQKPEKYYMEEEYRFVFIRKAIGFRLPETPFEFLNLGKRLEYASEINGDSEIPLCSPCLRES